MVEVVGSTPIAPTNKNKGLEILAPSPKAPLSQWGFFMAAIRKRSACDQVQIQPYLFIQYGLTWLSSVTPIPNKT